jgi:large subunit ribosomal protein L30
MLRIKLVKSPIGNNTRNRATVQALGLRKTQQVVEHEDTPTIRGMIHHVKHMLLVEEVESSVAAKHTPKKINAAKEVADQAAAAVAAEEPTPKEARKPRAKKEGDEK